MCGSEETNLYCERCGEPTCAYDAESCDECGRMICRECKSDGPMCGTNGQICKVNEE